MPRLTPAPHPDPAREAVTFRAAITERIRAARPSLADPALQLFTGQGKGVRPACVRLVGRACSPDGRVGERHDALAEAIELVHVGSLIHDDILDEAATRRGVPAVHVSYGSKVAVLAGDYLLSQATRRLASLDDAYLSGRLAEVIGDLCEGELLQDEQLQQLDVPLEAYLDRIAKKTASPFELASEGAARLAGAPPRTVAAARRFGFHLGRLFQLVDDWLDWAGDAAALGKPVGRDLLAGTLTLPVLVALGHPRTGAQLTAKLTPFPTVLDAELRALVAHPEVLEETRSLVAAEGDRAKRWLGELPPGPARAELADQVDRLLAQLDLQPDQGLRHAIP